MSAPPGPTQQGPHAHHVTFDPGGQRVLVTDKGIDQVVMYTLDTSAGKLIPSAPRLRGCTLAPRHGIWHFIPTAALPTSTAKRT